MAGSDIVRVYAEVSNRKGQARGVTHDDFYDNAVVTLRFASSALGTIDGTCPADYGYDARVEVLGTEGLLVIGDVRGQALLEVRDRDAGGRQPVHRTWPERFETGYREEMRAFAAAAVSGRPPNLVHYKELVVTGTTANTVDDCAEALDLVTGRFGTTGLVGRRYPLDEAREAFAAARSGRYQKVVVEP